MSFVSGLFVVCAARGCDSADLVTVRESWDEQDQIFVGKQRCSTCGCEMLYSRRQTTPQEIETMKNKNPRGRAKTRYRKPASHRVNTIKSNGALSESKEVAPKAVPIGEAMRLAVDKLGDIVIVDLLAPQQLRELATDYEAVTRAQAAFNVKADEAKIAKKTLESATNLLLEKLRTFTHAIPLPLFDVQQAEADRADMLDAGNATSDASPMS